MQTIYGQHIEAPEKPFEVEFYQNAYFNVFHHPAKIRSVKVMAQTERGALQIARYHFYISGRNFILRSR